MCKYLLANSQLKAKYKLGKVREVLKLHHMAQRVQKKCSWSIIKQCKNLLSHQTWHKISTLGKISCCNFKSCDFLPSTNHCNHCRFGSFFSVSLCYASENGVRLQEGLLLLKVFSYHCWKKSIVHRRFLRRLVSRNKTHALV